MMDDTLADESGIPKLAISDDIPVHSTPIKGGKIPLPSTKSVMRSLMSKHANRDDYEESLQMIKPSEDTSIVPSYRGQNHCTYSKSVKRPYEDRIYEKERFISSQSKDYQYSGKDLSNIDNLRPRVNEHPSDRAFIHERAKTPDFLTQKFTTEKSGYQPEGIGNKLQTYQSNDLQQKNFSRNSETHDPGTVGHGINSRSASGSGSKERQSETVSNTAGDSSRQATSARMEISSAANGKGSHDSVKLTVFSRVINDSLDLSQPASPRDRANADSPTSAGKVSKVSDPASNSGKQPQKDWKYTGGEFDDVQAYSKKRPTIHSPKLDRKTTNGSLSRQNASFTELENTTLQKQRQEIQLLVAELRDRDRELSEMASAHQQQLVAWEQDRQRLVAVERKCTQYEEDLRSKTAQLRNYVANLKSMRTRETETLQEIETLKSTCKQLTKDNDILTADNAKLKENTAFVQKSLDELHSTMGKLRAREEELVTIVRLKEKDISSATGHMRELSERLQQLDLRAKECQDRERTALRERDDWKQRHSTLQEEIHTVQRELDKKRREASHLSDENKSARQQLSLVQKEAAMMEKCKDELIESIKVKQERTDAQLKNFRELYERQLKEIASLQMQLDTSKEARHRLSIEEPHSYQGRNSHVSETSLEHSNGSQHTLQSAHNNVKYREPDTQSSGYQSQLSEHPPHQSNGNQPGHGYHGDNMAGNYSRQQHQHGDLPMHRNYSTRNHTRNFSSDTESSHSRRLSDIDNNSQPLILSGERLYSHMEASGRSNLNGGAAHEWSSRTRNSDSNLDGSYQESRSATTSTANQDPRMNSRYGVAKIQASMKSSESESDSACGSAGANVQPQTKYSLPECVVLKSNMEFYSSEKQHESNGPVKKDTSDHRKESSVKTECNNNSKCSNEEKQVQSFPSGQMEFNRYSLAENNLNNKETDPALQNSECAYKNYNPEVFMRFSDRICQGEPSDNNHPHHEMETNPLNENNGARNRYNSREGEDSGKGNSEVDSAHSQYASRDAVANERSSLDRDFEKRYTFENKLCSFLEDIDDIDDSIWNDPPTQNVNFSNLSSGETSSPASKLRKLLIESEQMIQSLEKSAESPIRKDGNRLTNQQHKGGNQNATTMTKGGNSDTADTTSS